VGNGQASKREGYTNLNVRLRECAGLTKRVGREAPTIQLSLTITGVHDVYLLSGGPRFVYSERSGSKRKLQNDSVRDHVMVKVRELIT